MVDYRPYQKLSDFFIDQIMGAFSSFDMEALHSGCKRLKPGDVFVEVGTYYGRSTYCAAQFLNEDVKMFAVDITDPGDYPGLKSRKQFWEDTGLNKRVTYINMPSVAAAEDWEGFIAWPGTKIDMMFIDADHSYEGVKSDVDAWFSYLKSGGYIYFHDADATSPGVEKLVRQLNRSKKFTDLTFYKDVQDNNTSMASVRKI